MANSEAMYVKAPVDDVDSQRRSTSTTFKVGIALIGGGCLALLCVVAMTASSSSLASETTSLIGLPASLRSTKAALPPHLQTLANQLPGASPWKELALAAMEQNNRCEARDVSMNAGPIKAMMANLPPKDKEMVVKAQAKAESMLKAGVTAPLGYFDPWGVSSEIGEGAILYYREAEIKHGRVCMLAILGMAVGENFHPLFGGGIDVAATKVFTQMPLADLWPFAFLQFLIMAGLEEKRTSWPLLTGLAHRGFNPEGDSEENFAVKGGRIPGDLGFDPLGLKPKSEADLITMQNKEILNGRLAMIALAGAVAQEMVTGEKIFG